MERHSLAKTQEESLWELIKPKYFIGHLSDEARWWYFEGHFWGCYEERARSESAQEVLLAYRDLLRERDEQIRTQRLIIKALRHEFTYSHSGDFNA